jgi:AraC-like DNA-binding protein
MLKLSSQDENFLAQLFKTLEEKYQDADFDMEDYGKAMAMSNSQLYRKTLALTGQSPNNLLRDYRLAKARERMKRSTSNITEISFDSGFSSPSYFTKCFKKKFGMLPVEYTELSA